MAMRDEKRKLVASHVDAVTQIIRENLPASGLDEKALSAIRSAIEARTVETVKRKPRPDRGPDAVLRHRKRLADNPSSHVGYDKAKLEESLIPHLRKAGARNAGHKLKQHARQEFIEIILEAQGRKPFFHVDIGLLPYCWNAPGHFELDYIVYQWGHLTPQNSSAPVKEKLQNLCLQSERCNQHVQSGISVPEVAEWLKGSAVAARIEEMRMRFDEVFAGEKWKRLCVRLMQPVPKGQKAQI